MFSLHCFWEWSKRKSAASVEKWGFFFGHIMQSKARVCDSSQTVMNMQQRGLHSKCLCWKNYKSMLFGMVPDKRFILSVKRIEQITFFSNFIWQTKKRWCFRVFAQKPVIQLILYSAVSLLSLHTVIWPLQTRAMTVLCSDVPFLEQTQKKIMTADSLQSFLETHSYSESIHHMWTIQYTGLHISIHLMAVLSYLCPAHCKQNISSKTINPCD